MPELFQQARQQPECPWSPARLSGSGWRLSVLLQREICLAWQAAAGCAGRGSAQQKRKWVLGNGRSACKQGRGMSYKRNPGI